MTIPRKQIIITCGPAGAGKSTFLKRMASLDQVTVISNSLGKRSFESGEAATKSFLNDINKIQMALIAPTPVTFIDRCFISQQVYHCIRTGQDLPEMGTLFRQWRRLILILEQDLHSRLRPDGSSTLVELTYLFLIPSVKQLERRRQTGGKEYPNSPKVEVQLYKEMSREAVFSDNFVVVPSYETIEDQNQLIQGFGHWAENPDDIWSYDLWKSLRAGARG